MSRGFRKISGRAARPLAAFGLLAVAVAAPGCGDASGKKEEGASATPANVRESNKNMENFMKSQKTAKKS
jgi:hypothetical protein